MTIQIPNIILPTARVGVEAMADAAQHISLSLPVRYLQEKTVQVYAAIAAGAPAPLNIWVELAPSDTAALYVIVGVPTVIVATENAILQWTTHSEFARVIAQVPAWAAGTWEIAIHFLGASK